MRVWRVSLSLSAAWLLAACGGGNRPTLTGSDLGGIPRSIECAPYARQVSGIQLFGDAASWWEGAAGRYRRSAQPAPGAALVFQRSGRLPHGHVSVVAAIRSPREIDVTQANWVHGRVARSEPVVDLSPGNDWTLVRVWWAPAGALGTTPYPTFGFVMPEGAGGDLMATADPGAPAAMAQCGLAPATD